MELFFCPKFNTLVDINVSGDAQDWHCNSIQQLIETIIIGFKSLVV